MASDYRPWEELRSTGLLWLINRVVFHPRGWALCLHRENGEIVGWNLLGDGREVWRFEGDEDEQFARVLATLAPRDSQDEQDEETSDPQVGIVTASDLATARYVTGGGIRSRNIDIPLEDEGGDRG